MQGAWRSWLRWLGVAAFWLSWPVLWVYFRRGERTRVLVRCGDEVLLVKSWLGDGRWILPGGGLHRGEDPRSGAVRELREETGISLRPDRLQPLGKNIYRDKGFHFPCHYFVVELHERPPLILQRHEIAEARWADLRTPAKQRLGADVQHVLAAWRAWRP